MIRDLKNVKPCHWCERAEALAWFWFRAAIFAVIAGLLAQAWP